MIKKIIMVPVFLLLAALIFYAGTCIVVNVRDSGLIQVNLPDGRPDVEYQVIIVNTGQPFLTDNVTDDGQVVNLYGYYEKTEKGWREDMEPISLDRKIFGDIIITRNRPETSPD